MVPGLPSPKPKHEPNDQKTSLPEPTGRKGFTPSRHYTPHSHNAMERKMSPGSATEVKRLHAGLYLVFLSWV